MFQIQERILSIFVSQAPLSNETRDDLFRMWTRKVNLKRSDFLAAPGQVESHLFYVIRGSLRIYFPHKEEEICVGFAYDHSLICSYPSFIQQKNRSMGFRLLQKLRRLLLPVRISTR